MLLCTIIGNHWDERIQISIIGTPSEILMEGDIILFRGEVIGNITYTNTSGSETTVPWLKVYAESIKVDGYETL